MRRRHPHPHPRAWLVSDERLAIAVERLAAHVPPGSGLLLRHDRLSPGARWRLARRLARIAGTRRLLLLIAAPPAVARRWGIEGVHLRQKDAHRAAQARRLGLRLSMPVHDPREARAVRRARAGIAFISPLFATRSHPEARPLGIRKWCALARLAGARPVALGGMTAARARQLARQCAPAGSSPEWAAIGAWETDVRMARRSRAGQKRKAVPT